MRFFEGSQKGGTEMSWNAFVKITENMKRKMQSEEYKNSSRRQEQDFTRNRKIGLFETCMMILKSSKKVMRSTIESFLKETKAEYHDISKAAFCKARQKIKPEAFKEIAEFTAEEFYREYPAKTLNGFRIFAVDGSVLNLPNTEETLAEFGSQKNQWSQQVQIHLSMLYDVLNHTVLDTIARKADDNERVMASEHLEKYEKFKGEKAIVVFDRGYPSEKLIQEMDNRGVYYIIRTDKAGFWKQITNNKNKPDAIITRKCKNGKELTVRVITIGVTESVQEILLTNLFDSKLDVDFFNQAYHLRWKIESNFNLMKNQMQLENFSGVLPICILQDIYAQTILLNLAACLEAECNHDVDEINAGGERKYPLAVNRSVCISELKDNVIELFWASPKRKERILRRIRSVMLKNLSEVHDNRHYPRDNPKHPSCKYHNNYRAI